MKLLAILLLSVALAIPAQRISLSLRSQRATRAGEISAPQSAPALELRLKIDKLKRESAQLCKRLQRLGSSAGTSVEHTDPTLEIAAALERWLEAHPLPAAERDSPEAVFQAAIPAIADLSIHEILELFSIGGFGEADTERIFKELRDSGRMDEYIDALKKLTEGNPSNADLHTALGVAYLQKLFGIPPGPESGVLAMQADGAFDQALEIDPTNWSARFTKAVSLSNWPAFLGRTGEAIENFKTLIAQQETLPGEPQFAQTYLFLGNMYQQIGEGAKALETWRKGSTLFPESSELLDQLELLEDK
jgi:tetratricopeptide (TPR) repeat protein